MARYLGPPLTRGAIRSIVAGNTDTQPVLQVIDVKLIHERFLMELSDGENYHPVMLATQLNDKVKSGEVSRHTVLRVKEYLCNAVQGRMIVIVQNMDVVGAADDSLGNPQPLGGPTPSHGGAEGMGSPAAAPPQAPLLFAAAPMDDDSFNTALNQAVVKSREAEPEALLALMRACGADMRRLLMCVTLLSATCYTPRNTEAARRAGAVDDVLAALEVHAENAEVQRLGLAALVQFVRLSRIFDSLDRVRAVNAVMAALTSHMAEAKVVKAACVALSSMIQVDNQLLQLTSMTSVGETVLTALSTHRAHAGVQANGLCVFGDVITINENLFLGESALAAQAVQDVLAALRSHADPFVHRFGLRLLALLLLRAPLRALPRDCVHIVVSSMRAHLSDADLQSSCFMVFECLLQDDYAAEYGARVVAAGGVEAAMAALRAHAAHKTVQCGGFRTLYLLSIRDTATAERAICAGTLQLKVQCDCAVLVEIHNKLVELLQPVHATLAEHAAVDAAERAAAEAAERAAAHASAVAAADRVAAELIASEEAERTANAPAASKRKKKKKKAGGVPAAVSGSAAAAHDSDDGGSAAAGAARPDATTTVEDDEAADVAHPSSASALRRRRRVAAKVAHRSGGGSASAGILADAAGGVADQPAAAAEHDAAAVGVPAASAPAAAPTADVASPADVASCSGVTADASAFDVVTAQMAELFPWIRMVAAGVQPAAAAADVAADEANAEAAAAPPLPPAAAPEAAAVVAAAAHDAAAAAELARLRAFEDAFTCAICLEAPRCAALLPCRHMLLCASPACAAALGAPPRCPLCREEVSDTLQLFV